MEDEPIKRRFYDDRFLMVPESKEMKKRRKAYHPEDKLPNELRELYLKMYSAPKPDEE